MSVKSLRRSHTRKGRISSIESFSVLDVPLAVSIKKPPVRTDLNVARVLEITLLACIIRKHLQKALRTVQMFVPSQSKRVAQIMPWLYLFGSDKLANPVRKSCSTQCWMISLMWVWCHKVCVRNWTCKAHQLIYCLWQCKSETYMYQAIIFVELKCWILEGRMLWGYPWCSSAILFQPVAHRFLKPVLPGNGNIFALLLTNSCRTIQV